MAVKTTKELFEEFFKTKDPDVAHKTRAQVDRPEVYAYEKKIGKQLLDMNEEELFEMISSFNNRRSSVSDGLKVGSGSFKKYVSNLRVIFQFYIDNCDSSEVIRNPFHSKKFKDICSDALLADNKNRFTYKKLEEIIEELHGIYDEDRADYYELIIRLFYDGFSKSQEIVDLKESQINFRKMEVCLPGRIVKLSNRCFELLTKVHDMEKMESQRGDYCMMGWCGGYFKFIIRPSEAHKFDDKDISDVGRKINVTLFTRVSKEVGVDVGYRKLYLLGFYDTLVKRYGEEHTREIITSNGNTKHINELVSVMYDYGMTLGNTTYLKRSLVQFI